MFDFGDFDPFEEGVFKPVMAVFVIAFIVVLVAAALA